MMMKDPGGSSAGLRRTDRVAAAPADGGARLAHRCAPPRRLPRSCSPAAGRPTTPIPPARTLHTPRSGTRRAPTIEPVKRARRGRCSSSWPRAPPAPGSGMCSSRMRRRRRYRAVGRVDTVIVTCPGRFRRRRRRRRPTPSVAAPATSATDSASVAGTLPIRRCARGAAASSAGAVVAADSGALKIVGLPAGSSVLIDGEPVTDAVTRLAGGPPCRWRLRAAAQFLRGDGAGGGGRPLRTRAGAGTAGGRHHAPCPGPAAPRGAWRGAGRVRLARSHLQRRSQLLRRAAAARSRRPTSC